MVSIHMVNFGSSRLQNCGELTLLIRWRALGANAARQVADQIFICANTLDVKRTASTERVAHTCLLL